ncbi:hypothetical protein [Streptomyces adustus]|uniref:hypothetical protein n=1 Tax=Streptomyces adustus TaxID=1609272 RepID=UPI003719F9BC
MEAGPGAEADLTWGAMRVVGVVEVVETMDTVGVVGVVGVVGLERGEVVRGGLRRVEAVALCRRTVGEGGRDVGGLTEAVDGRGIVLREIEMRRIKE